MQTKIKKLFLILLLIASLTGCSLPTELLPTTEPQATAVTQESQTTSEDVGTSESTGESNASGIVETPPEAAVDLSTIEDYSTSPYAEVNGNIPGFTEAEMTTTSFEYYSDLDALGRCGTTYACIGQDIMPTEERGEIGMVKPTGWHTVKYDNIDGLYLYNRCHLIGYQLTGENANEKNLITGTRYLNVEGMLPFENEVADYVHKSNNHVLCRVTPIFEGDNLVASGVQMEAYSVEDAGAGVCLNVYIYNVQPGIEIDYATGESWQAASTTAAADSSEETETYVLNTNSKKFHKPDCSGAADISSSNRQEYTGTRSDLILRGYTPCGHCNP